MSETIFNIHENLIMKNIMDKSKDLNEIIEGVKKIWNFDLFSRKPTPAIYDGEYSGTDLDISIFLYTLAERSSHITIPKYDTMRPRTLSDSQIVTSKDNRNGKIVSLTSNKDIFAFSIKIFDENILNSDSTKGGYRNFTITDPNGDVYEGFKGFNCTLNSLERQFLEEKNVIINNKLYFKYFVHPNRWTSIYGQKYYITKALIERIADECKNLFSQIKRMKTNGIEFPEKETVNEWPKTLKEDGKSVKFKSLEIEIDYPTIGDYKIYDDSLLNLIYLSELRKKLLYTILPSLRFITRCSELAFYKYNPGHMPHWLFDAKWDLGFKLPKKRIEWDRLDLNNQFSIRKRIKEKSEIMAKHYKEREAL